MHFRGLLSGEGREGKGRGGKIKVGNGWEVVPDTCYSHGCRGAKIIFAVQF